MGNWFIRAGFIIVFSCILSYLPAYVSTKLFATGFLNTIYTVVGVMFPLGLNQIMSFSFADVERDAFVIRYRADLGKIRVVFVCLFFTSTVLFLMYVFVDFVVQWKFMRFDFRYTCMVFMLYCLLHYVYNFMKLAKLKNEIEDKIREAKKTELARG